MKSKAIALVGTSVGLALVAFMLGQASVPAGARPLDEVGKIVVTSSADGNNSFVWVVQGIQNEDKTTQTIVRYVGRCSTAEGITISYTGLDDNGKFGCKTQVFDTDKGTKK